jgi:hypothetical protein
MSYEDAAAKSSVTGQEELKTPVRPHYLRKVIARPIWFHTYT